MLSEPPLKSASALLAGVPSPMVRLPDLIENIPLVTTRSELSNSFHDDETRLTEALTTACEAVVKENAELVMVSAPEFERFAFFKSAIIFVKEPGAEKTISWLFAMIVLFVVGPPLNETF